MNIVDRFGSLWIVLGSLWVVVDRRGSLWVVPRFSSYERTARFAVACIQESQKFDLFTCLKSNFPNIN